MAPSKGHPEVFTTRPKQLDQKKPGQLTESQLKQYFEQGYVIVKDLFTIEELQPVIDGVNELVNNLANRLFAAGKITDKYENATFYERLILLEKEWKCAPVLLHRRGCLPEGFRYIWSHEKLLNIVEQLIGPDISGHPVWNLRTKTPGNVETTVPWHQDNAYLEEGSDSIHIPTAWVPLIDANLVNGCMMVAAGGHKKGITVKHACCAGPTWYVEADNDDMKNKLDVDTENDSVVCEVPFGGILLINNVIPHRSMLNKSDKVRWSVDLRWHKTEENNFFYGIKESIPMRKAGVDNLEIDWGKFVGPANQHDIEAKYAKEAGKHDELKINEKDAIEKDAVVTGPWMTRWEIVHHNQHTAGIKTSGNTATK